MNTDTIATAPSSTWQELPAPPGATVLLLTKWGTAVKGTWYRDGEFVAWAPLPQIPENIRKLMGVGYDTSCGCSI